MAEQTSFEEKMNSEESKTTKMNVQSEETYGSSDLQNQEKKEKAWCWVVCFAAFLIILMRKGFLLSFGLILPDILKEFKQSKAKTAWIGSIAAFFAYLFGPVTSALSKRFGHHIVIISGGILCSIGLVLTPFATKLEYMYISFGFIAGIGCCLSYTPIQVVLSSCFHKNKPLAMNIAASGSNAGMLAMGPLVTYLNQIYGWRTTYRLLATQGVLIAVLALTFRPSKCFPHKQSREKHSFFKMFKLCFDKDLLKNKMFIAYLIAVTATAFGFFVPKTFLMAYASEIGINPSKASQLYIYLGVSAICGKFTIGMISRTGKIRNSLLCQICIFFSGLTAAFSGFGSSYTGLVLFAVFYGLFDGAYGGITPVTILEVVGQEKMNCAWGNLLCFESFAILLGPPISGVFIDIFNSYKPLFYVTGIFPILSSFILFYITCKPRNDQEDRSTTEAREL